MKKEYKAHPLIMLKLIKPFLILLLLPVIRAVLQYLAKGEVDGLLGFEILALFLITLIAYLRYRKFSVSCDQNKVCITTGIIFSRYSEIEISKLSSVQTLRTPIDYIFGSMTFRINTEAGRINHSDFEFKLKFSDGKELSNLLYGDETVSKQRFSAVKVALMAAATSSAFTGLIIGVPIINRAGNLLGIALSEMLFNEITNVSSKIETTFPPIVNTVSLIFLLAYSISFLYSFFKFINFKVVLGEENLEVRSGFFTRLRTSFRRSAINNVRIEQTALMLLFKRFSMKVSVGGFGEAKSESQVIVPSGRYREIKKDFSRYFSFLEPDGVSLKPKKTFWVRARFLYWPTVCLITVLAISITLSLYFDEFSRFILFLTFIALCFVFYYAYVSILEYRHGEIKIGNCVYASGKRGLRTSKLYCPKENVGQIKISRFFTDFYYQQCKVLITVCSESADSILLRHLDYDTAKQIICDGFNLE